MSLSNSPSSTSRVQSPQNTPIIPASCSPKLMKRMQQEICYICDQGGHWSYYCPYKSSKTKPISPSPKQDSTVSHKRAHGSCGYGVTEDEFLNGNSKSIARLKQGRQRTLYDFWEGCQGQNDDTGDGSQEQIKRIRITDCCENPNIEGASATQNAANVKRDGFPELEFAHDDIEFMNSVPWETIEAEAILSLSRRSTPSRIRWRQIMFQKRIFSDDSFEMDNKSKENSLTMDEQNNLFEENKMRFAQLQDEYVKTEASLEASKQHKQLLCEQVSNIKTMLDEKQNQLKCCELKILNIETRLGDLKRRILETDFTLKERVEQTEEARKQSEERQAKQQ